MPCIAQEKTLQLAHCPSCTIRKLQWFESENVPRPEIQGSETRFFLSRFGFFKGISLLCILVSFAGIGLRSYA